MLILLLLHNERVRFLGRNVELLATKEWNDFARAKRLADMFIQ
jgi:hypothetical protein